MAPRHLRPVVTDPEDTLIADFEDDPLEVETITVTVPEEDRGTDSPRRFALAPDRSVALIEVRSTVGPDQLRRRWHHRPYRSGRGRRQGEPRAATVRSRRRSRSTACAPATASTTPSCCDASMPAASRRQRSTSPNAWPAVRGPVPRVRRAHLPRGDPSCARNRERRGAPSGRLVVTGEQVFDIRDFDVPSPTVLMLRIYPDVRVHLHVEAELEEE